MKQDAPPPLTRDQLNMTIALGRVAVAHNAAQLKSAQAPAKSARAPVPGPYKKHSAAGLTGGHFAIALGQC